MWFLVSAGSGLRVVVAQSLAHTPPVSRIRCPPTSTLTLALASRAICHPPARSASSSCSRLVARPARAWSTAHRVRSARTPSTSARRTWSPAAARIAATTPPGGAVLARDKSSGRPHPLTTLCRSRTGS
jgi:hypothetical protein